MRRRRRCCRSSSTGVAAFAAVVVVVVVAAVAVAAAAAVVDSSPPSVARLNSRGYCTSDSNNNSHKAGRRFPSSLFARRRKDEGRPHHQQQERPQRRNDDDTSLPVKDDDTGRRRRDSSESSPAFLVLSCCRRGGYQQQQQQQETTEDGLSLDEKVRKAMLKLGLTPPSTTNDDGEASGADAAGGGEAKDAAAAEDGECAGGVCEMPKEQQQEDRSSGASASSSSDVDFEAMASRLAEEFDVDESLAMAAIGATRRRDDDDSSSFDHEGAARELLRQEMDRIAEVSEDSAAVRTLVEEGYDSFLSRRALAFADMNLDDARAILMADQMDQEEDRQREAEEADEDIQQERRQQENAGLKTVNVDANFDPTAIRPEDAAATAPPPTTPSGGTMPTPAKKEDVVFEATAAQIQELVLESPVPVLLDVYADWCGPCKVLGPALEEMAVKSGGVFRLVKVNTDNERPVSQALEVQALPTVFGIKDGKILNMFQGMPKSEKAMQSFMMGLLVGESNFDPPISAEQKKQYYELTLKLVKMAGAASFPFSSRERLQDRINDRLDELSQQAPDFVAAEESTRILRSLISNVIRDPYETKFRSVNLKNKVISSNIGKYPASLAILKSVGFRPPTAEEGDVNDSEGVLILKKKIVNVAPLLVARDCIDKWVDKTRHEVAKAARKRRDEEHRVRLREEAAERGDDGDVENEEPEDVAEEDPDACTIMLRIEGKKKVHELSLHADDPLRSVLDKLPEPIADGQEAQITCVARRLVVQSSDEAKMKKTLRELRLAPSAAIVVAIGAKTKEESSSNNGASSLSQRASSQKKKKKGSHTMQSIGIYSKDDNAKAELIDGGGGVWYEHDVTEDEDEGKEADDKQEGEDGEAAEKAVEGVDGGNDEEYEVVGEYDDEEYDD